MIIEANFVYIHTQLYVVVLLTNRSRLGLGEGGLKDNSECFLWKETGEYFQKCTLYKYESFFYILFAI